MSHQVKFRRKMNITGIQELKGDLIKEFSPVDRGTVKIWVDMDRNRDRGWRGSWLRLGGQAFPVACPIRFEGDARLS